MANPIHENYLDKVDLRRGNKFHAVAQQIAQDIMAGKYEERLPSVRELCEIHGVTLVTMDKAVKVLKANGLITVKHAKGMFVTRLKRKRTGRILFVGHTGDLNLAPVHAAFASGLRAACTAKGLQLLLEHHDRKPRKELAVIQDLWEREQIDGVVLWECRDEKLKTRTYLQENNIPFVLSPELGNDSVEGCHWVTVEEAHVLEDALEHLFSLGHERIGFVMLNSATPEHYHQVRYKNYREGMEKAGLKALPAWRVPASNEIKATPALMKKIHSLTAILCCTDRVAAALSTLCLREGIRVPGDLALVGYDDSSISQFLDMTSLDPQNRKIGELAVKLLVDEIEGRLNEPTHLSTRSLLVVRGSTVPARKKR